MNEDNSILCIKSGKRLDELNRKIWESGFDSLILSELDTVAKEINDGTTLFERIPQEQLSGLSARYGLLCQAAVICRGCPCTESESREIYRTDDLVGDGKIQQSLIEQWARLKGVWYDNPEIYLSGLSQVRDELWFDVEVPIRVCLPLHQEYLNALATLAHGTRQSSGRRPR